MDDSLLLKEDIRNLKFSEERSRSLYVNSSHSLSIEKLMAELMVTRKGAHSIQKYFLRVLHVLEELQAAGEHVDEQVMIDVTLDGLPDGYARFKRSIRARGSEITLAELMDLLAAETPKRELEDGNIPQATCQPRQVEAATLEKAQEHIKGGRQELRSRKLKTKNTATECAELRVMNTSAPMSEHGDSGVAKTSDPMSYLNSAAMRSENVDSAETEVQRFERVLSHLVEDKPPPVNKTIVNPPAKNVTQTSTPATTTVDQFRFNYLQGVSIGATLALVTLILTALWKLVFPDTSEAAPTESQHKSGEGSSGNADGTANHVAVTVAEEAKNGGSDQVGGRVPGSCIFGSIICWWFDLIPTFMAYLTNRSNNRG